MRSLSSLAVLCLMAACNTAPPATDHDASVQRDSLAPIQTDSLNYHLFPREPGWETAIPFEYRNLSDDSLYVVNCNGALQMTLEKRVSGSWKTFWSPVLPACLSPPIVIPPRAVHSDTLRLFGARPNRQSAPEFPDTMFEGTYRLVWHAVVTDYDERRPGFGTPVTLERRYSNAFTLRRTDRP